MKNHLLVTLLITLIQTGMLFGQNIYNDALELRKLNPQEDEGKVTFGLQNNEYLKAAKILSKYVIQNDSSSYDTISKVFFNNPFISLPILGNLNERKSKFFSIGASSAISGINVTTFADGLAQFLVDRAMQELDVAFFSKFKEFLVKNPEAKILFPTTTDYISNFSPHEYALFIVSLRESFYNDLKNLIYNVDDVFLLPKYAKLIDDYPEITISINCVQMIVDLEEGTHPMEVLEKLIDLEAWKNHRASIDKKPALLNLLSGLKTSFLLANSVRTNQNYTFNNWVSISDFRKNILEDPIAFNIFLGLIYQQAMNEDIKFSYKRSETASTDTTKHLKDFLKENKMRIIVFQNIFLEMIQKGTLVDQAIANFDPKKKPTREDFYQYINASIEVIEFGFKVSTLVAPKETENKYDAYLILARQGNNLYRNVYQKQYSAAILNACSIFELTFEEVKQSRTLDSLAKNPKAYTKKINKSLDEDIKVLPDILRYGTFMANVIEAEEPSQVKAAIESAVLPVGSSTVKKYYRHNISVNAYLGGFYRFKEVEIVQQSWDARFGFTAPVGISYTPFSFGKGGALSLFLPLIDVGALAQFRISDTTSQIEEDISLGNIFSPGIFAVYGLPFNLPISIGFGRQYGPGLVSFDASTPNVINPRGRTNFFLAVDIPLFNLSKGKRPK